MDVMDACLLMTSREMKDVNGETSTLANGLAMKFRDIPGLRTLDFTMNMKGDKVMMNNFYIFTNMKACKDFMGA
jgi:hypothetical protein